MWRCCQAKQLPPDNLAQLLSLRIGLPTPNWLPYPPAEPNGLEPTTNGWQERDTANEKLASTSALLETSEKNLADAEARCRALEEAAGGEEEKEANAAAGQREAEARAAAAEEKVSAAEQEKSGLREEVCVCAYCVWYVRVLWVLCSRWTLLCAVFLFLACLFFWLRC